MINSEKSLPVIKTFLLSATTTTLPLLMQQYFTPMVVGVTAVCGLVLTIYKMLNEISKFYNRKKNNSDSLDN